MSSETVIKECSVVIEIEGQGEKRELYNSANGKGSGDKETPIISAKEAINDFLSAEITNNSNTKKNNNKV